MPGREVTSKVKAAREEYGETEDGCVRRWRRSGVALLKAVALSWKAFSNPQGG